MRQYVIWLICLQLCCSEYADYSDYHPKNIPVNSMPSMQYENPSPEYKEVMKNLCGNWQSPIPYLKKRGYMPEGHQEKNNVKLKKDDENKVVSKGENHLHKGENYLHKGEKYLHEGENYFFFPQNEVQSLKENFIAMEDDDNSEPEGANTEPPVTESPNSNNTSGIINKVRDKFISIFAHKGNDEELKKTHEEETKKDGRGNLLDWNYDIDDTEFLENSKDYEVSDRRIYVRSATEKPENISNPFTDDFFNNFTDTEIQYVKSFINCFKQSKNDFEIQPSAVKSTTSSKPSESTTTSKSSTKTTTIKPSADSKNGEVAKASEAKPSESKENEAKPSDAKPSDTKPSDAKPSDATPSDAKPNEAKPSEAKPVESKPSESEPILPKIVESTTVGKMSPTSTILCDPVASTESIVPKTSTPPASSTTTKSTINPTVIPPAFGTTTKSNNVPPALSTTSKSNTDPNRISTTKTTNIGGKNGSDNFTVDLDINQKKGNGEENHLLIEKCACIASALAPSTLSPLTDREKYDTKSKFLAHLHHMVDEVGKPPRKPLDLAMVQDVIDNIKNPTIVIMSDGKTTECAPLRLNDMSFDLEWNKIDKTPARDREKMNILDIPQVNQPQGQSLAAKFLQDVNSYPNNNEEYLNTPYGDNFLDSQQTLPDNLDLPLKISTKREAVLPSSAGHSRKLSKLLSDIASLPDPQDDDDYYTDDESRRIKDQMKSGRKQKSKTKIKGGASKKSTSNTADINVVTKDSDDANFKRGNDFNAFDELKDIQFRVNDDDEEAISRFIANLNSPPEVFSFDVDKYLRSAKMDMQPQAPELEFQSDAPRTYYEFMDTPAIEQERLPDIDAPPDVEDEPPVEKRSRPSGGKRDLLRQYIKGVSNALNHDMPELNIDCHKSDEDKPQRSPNLDTDISFRTNNLVDGFSSNLDAMNYIKSNDRDDFLDNFYLLNDGSSQIFDLAKQDPEMVPNDKFSPQSLEIDLELDKKFRDLGIGSYNGADRFQQYPGSANDVKSDDDAAEVNPQNERRDFNDEY